jgi:hypothetical protein
MPARLMEAKPWKSFSIREQPGWHAITAAVQKQPHWLDVHTATLVNRSGVFVTMGESYCVVLDPTDVIMCHLYSELSFLECHQN